MGVSHECRDKKKISSSKFVAMVNTERREKWHVHINRINEDRIAKIMTIG